MSQSHKAKVAFRAPDTNRGFSPLARFNWQGRCVDCDWHSKWVTSRAQAQGFADQHEWATWSGVV